MLEKIFDILAISLNFLHNYFDGPKLFFSRNQIVKTLIYNF